METDQIIRSINAHKQTLLPFAVNFGASVLPLLFAALLARAVYQWNGFDALLNNGELYIYAIGFYVQAMYALYKLKRGRLTEVTDVLFWISVLVFVLSAFLYSLLATSLESGAKFDVLWLYNISLMSFFISLIISYISTYIDMKQALVDVREEENKAVEDIKRNYKPE